MIILRTFSYWTEQKCKSVCNSSSDKSLVGLLNRCTLHSKKENHPDNQETNIYNYSKFCYNGGISHSV